MQKVNAVLGEKSVQALSTSTAHPSPSSQLSTTTTNNQGPVFLSNSHLKKKKKKPATFYLLKPFHVYYHTSNCPVIKLLCKSSIWENWGKRKFDLSKAPQNWERTPVPEFETRLSLLRLTLSNLFPRAGLQALGEELSQGGDSAEVTQW